VRKHVFKLAQSASHPRSADKGSLESACHSDGHDRDGDGGECGDPCAGRSFTRANQAAVPSRHGNGAGVNGWR